MRRSSLTRRMKAKEAAEMPPASRKSREPKLKERKREKKRRRKVRRKQKVSIHFFSHSHLTAHVISQHRDLVFSQIVLFNTRI